MNDVPIKVTILRHIAVEIYKILNGMSPSYLDGLFKVRDVQYNFRDSSRLEQPRVRTSTYGIKSLRYYGAKIWNNLPTDIKSACSLNEFKGMLNKWSGPTCLCEVCNMV